MHQLSGLWSQGFERLELLEAAADFGDDKFAKVGAYAPPTISSQIRSCSRGPASRAMLSASRQASGLIRANMHACRGRWCNACSSRSASLSKSTTSTSCNSQAFERRRTSSEEVRFSDGK